MIGLSNSILLELLNLPALLLRSGIPLYKSERLRREELPLIILGGANAFHSSIFWNERTLVDGVFVGEDPAAIRRLIEACREGKTRGLNKSEILQTLSAVPGFIEPDQPAATRRAWSNDFYGGLDLAGGPSPHSAETAGRAQLQISEGCPCFCSFCAEGWQRKPYREKTAAELLNLAKSTKARLGLSGIDIYSFNFNQHAQIYELLWNLIPLFERIGLKSQRFDLLAREPKLIEVLHALDKSSLTCGLEGVSARLRRYLHKNLAPEDLERALSAIFQSRARELKIFLIATGLETEEDFQDFAQFVRRLKALRESARAGTRIIFSITPLIRFPGTPLEFEPAVTPDKMKAILRRLQAAAEEERFEFRSAASLQEFWVSQLLARAWDSRVSEVLVKALLESGFTYYREIDEDFAAKLKFFLEEAQLSLATLLEEPQDHAAFPPPWTRVDLGVRREFLHEQHERARSFSEIDYCLGRPDRAGNCSYCGACAGGCEIKRMTAARPFSALNLECLREHLRCAAKDKFPCQLLLELHARTRGLPRAEIAAALARALMLAHPELIAGYKGFSSSSFDGLEPAAWIFGLEKYELLWASSAAGVLAQLLNDPDVITAANAHFSPYGRLSGAAPKDWSPSAFLFSSPFPLKADEYLKKRGLKHTLRKPQAFSRRFEFNKESLKKGIIKSLEAAETPAGMEVKVVPGPKFNSQDFMRESFQAKPSTAWVRILARAV